MSEVSALPMRALRERLAILDRGQPSLGQRLEVANTLLQLGRFQMAQQAFAELLAAAPDDPAVRQGAETAALGSGAWGAPLIEAGFKQFAERGDDSAIMLYAGGQALRQARPALRVLDVLNRPDWARLNGYRPLPQADAMPPLPEVHFHRDYPAPWVPHYHEVTAKWVANSMIVEGDDIGLYSVGWALPGKIDDNHFYISKRDDLLSDDDYWLPYLHGTWAFPLVSQRAKRVVLDPLRPVVNDLQRGRYILMGGHGQSWGHWIADHLPMLYWYNRYYAAEGVKLVFGNLTPTQQTCLHFLGVPLDRVLNVTVGPNQCSMTRFEQAIIPTRLPPALGYSWLRGLFASRPMPPGADFPKRIYIARQETATQRRVANEDAVMAMLKSYGIEPLLLEKLSFHDQVRAVMGAELIVVPFGSGLANVHFSRPDCVAVVLFSSDAHDQTKTNLHLIYKEVVPFIFANGLHMVPVFGQPVTPSPMWNLNAPCHYELADLKRALEEAVAVVAERRG
ncbi:MAG: DUF563 domain-containing protein [Alphaproteobacteria bacterium]|nr:DUF563 domain-containing protein [Alphaproteobacteria bacterium]